MVRMLVHFRCNRCGAQLTARPDFAGQAVACTVCRRPVMVPVVTSPVPTQPRLKRIEPDDDLATEIAARALQEARGVALAEAKRATLRARLQGILLAFIGAAAGGVGAAALVLPDALWVPAGAAMAAMAFGALAMMIGIAVWRFAVQTMHDEFRRRVPGIADRLRRRLWESRRPAPPPNSPWIAAG